MVPTEQEPSSATSAPSIEIPVEYRRSTRKRTVVSYKEAEEEVGADLEEDQYENTENVASTSNKKGRKGKKGQTSDGVVPQPKNINFEEYFMMGQYNKSERGLVLDLSKYWPYPFGKTSEQPASMDLYLYRRENEKPEMENGEYYMNFEHTFKKVENFGTEATSDWPFRVFIKSQFRYYYLKTDDDNLAKLASKRNHSSLFKNILSSIELDYESPLTPFKFKDTFDFGGVQAPEGFLLQLREYQQRSLAWMLAVEDLTDTVHNTIHPNWSNELRKIKLGETGLFLDCSSKRPWLNKVEFDEVIPLRRLKGGILADDTGSGKTITCLALIHSNPFTSQHAIHRNNTPQFTFPSLIPSKATIVMAPSNLAEQWIGEVKKAVPSLVVFRITNIYDYRKLTFDNVISADLLIVSYEFLANENYKKIYGYETCPVTLEQLERVRNEKLSVPLSFFHFHRLILDEFHELGQHRGSARVTSLSADFKWGMTGTPQISLSEWCAYLQIEEPNNPIAKQEYLEKFVRRNEPNLLLPPLEKELIWISPSPSEVYLRHLKGCMATTRTKIMLCCHYQGEGVGSGEEFLSIDQVTANMINQKKDIIEKIRKDCYYTQMRLEELTRKEEKEEKELKEFTKLETLMTKLEADLEKAEEDHKNTELTFSVLRYSGERVCLFCDEGIKGRECFITACGHVFCPKCRIMLPKQYASCKACSKPIYSEKDIIPIVFPEDTDCGEKLLFDGIDSSNYGSKLIAVYNYIFRICAVDPNAKIILFLQYRELAQFISAELDKMNVVHSRVYGNVYTRQKAIDSYKSGKNVRLIMLSAEDSVSGLNLTETTHILILHPFYTGNGDQMDIAYEKQGIARAYRSGLDHTLKVVRFAVKDSIDEELTLQRQHLY